MPDAETKAFQLYAAIMRHQKLIEDAADAAWESEDDQFLEECCIADDELYIVAEKIMCGEDDA